MAAEGEVHNHKFLPVHKDMAFVVLLLYLCTSLSLSLSLLALGVAMPQSMAFVLTSLSLIARVAAAHRWQ